MAEILKICVKVTGRVQGVFYRQTTCEQARRLGLSGWVRNLEDGSVELEAQGPKEKIESLINWCQKGPPHARVENVEIKWQMVLSVEEIFADDFTIAG